MKDNRYENITPVAPIKRHFKVIHIEHCKEFEFIPLGFHGNKRTKNLWRTEKKYTYLHSKKRSVDSCEICTLPMSFDIETTSILTDSECTGYMYHWQFGIGDFIVLGRTWEEFDKLITAIINRLQLGEKEIKDKTHFFECRIWVANLGFEFQFLRFRYDVKDVFAKTSREPLTVLCDNGLFFQDALAITNSSLAKIPELYQLYTQKLVGDLDYSKIRNSLTYLDLTTEERYCINDVAILIEFADWLQVNYINNGLDIPYTKTGILRDSVKKNYLEWINDIKWTSEDSTKHRTFANSKKVRWLSSLFPKTYKEFLFDQQFLFRGGYTHGNSLHSFEKLYNVNGVDFTSSYPAVMIQKLYPMTKFTDYKRIPTIEEVIENSENGIASKVRICFYGLENITTHSIESISKTEEYHITKKSISKCRTEYGIICDNGRVISAKQLTVSLTDVDLKVYQMFYKWRDYEILSAQCSAYGKLPKYLTDVVIYYYALKAELKKKRLEDSTQYKIAKAMVNAAYGMMCEHLHLSNVEYINNEWKQPEAMPPEELQERYETEIFGKNYDGKKAPKKFLSMYWGIWVTAHARYNLLSMVAKIGNDCMYCDTDSIYLQHYYKYQDIIDNYNNKIYIINRKWVSEYNETHEDKIDMNHFIDLGEFDKLNKESNYIFKQGGAKRYIKMSRHFDKELKKWIVKKEQTIAGLPKKAYIKFCKSEKLDFFDTFSVNGFTIPHCKNAHCYNDYPHSDILIDSDNNTEKMTEFSSIGIFPIDFTMKLDSGFLAIVHQYAESRKPINFLTGEKL